MGKSDLDGCGQFMKYSLFIVNFIIFILGLTVCGLGIWAITDKAASIEKLIGTNYYVPAAGMLIAFGGIVAFISFLGCCGAIKEVKCLLGTFFVIMLLLAILIALAAIFGFVMKDKLGDEIQELIKQSIKEYGNEAIKKPVKDAWDDLQKNLECCGTDSYVDWRDHGFPEDQPFPQSCCKPENPNCSIGNTDSYYNEGCLSKIEAIIQKHSQTLAAVGISTAVVIILSMIFSCALCLMV